MEPQETLRELAQVLRNLADGNPSADELAQIRARIVAVEERLSESPPRARRGQGARRRILQYFRSRGVGVEVTMAELREVSGIQEWARRVRELRVEEGWDIRHEGYVYRLMSDAPDEAAAANWQLANNIRRRDDLNARERILEYLKANVASRVNGDMLHYVSGIHEWARRLRELRDEYGWPISSFHDRPELAPDEYLLEDLDRMEANVRDVSAATRREVFERDGYQCRVCGAVPGLGVWLEPDHVVEAAEGGSHGADNLITVCHRCHTVKTAEYQRLRRELRRERGRVRAEVDSQEANDSSAE